MTNAYRRKGGAGMELLLKRNETTNAVGLPRYDLFAKLELKPEERERLSKAKADTAFVWEDDTGSSTTRWRFCLIPGGILSLLFAVLLAAIFGTVFMILALPITLLGWIPFTKLVFNQVRPGITVGDIITGRTIHCKSMDELYVKENAIKEHTQKYCNYLEGMHSLGNEQKITFKPE
jgi:hypothetical protein